MRVRNWMAEKSKILIIGGTGYIGKHIVVASAKAGHPTFALVRESTLSDPAKAQIIDNFKSLGVNLVHVSCYHHLSISLNSIVCMYVCMYKRRRVLINYKV